MKHILNFNSYCEGISIQDYNKPNIQRSRSLSEEEFLDILKTNCKNFSFMSDELWRNKYSENKLELFTPDYRKAKPLAFPNFFDKIDDDPSYPVMRKKSLIGGTKKDIVKQLVGGENYLVIPFDNSEIIFCPVVDLWAMDDQRRKGTELVNKEPVDEKHFIKVTYNKNFEIPIDELESVASKYGLEMKGGGKHGYEFFTSSPCLLLHESKINWLRNNI